jgi:hypothetical protein
VDDVRGLTFEVRLASTLVTVWTGTTFNFAAGEFILESGLVPAQLYQVRAIYVPLAGRAVDWTSWVNVTTPDVRLTYNDLATAIALDIANASKVPAVTSLPANDALTGPVVFLTSDQKLYRWTGTAWTTAVTSADIVANAITAGKIAAGAVGATAMAANAITAANAAIADAAITTAKIGVAQIDTLRVGGNAITIPLAGERGSQSQSGTGWSGSLELYPYTENDGLGQPIVAIVYATISANAEIRLRINGVEVARYTSEAAATLFGTTQSVTLVGMAAAQFGSNQIRTEFRRSPDASGTATLSQSTLFCLLAKR